MGAITSFSAASPIRLFVPGSGLTLRAVYEQLLPELPAGMSPRSFVEQRSALKHWEAATGDPEVSAVDRAVLLRLRDYLIGRGLRPATVNKVWRTLRAMLRYACDQLHEIPSVPAMSYRLQSQLVEPQSLPQRELLSIDEITSLWEGCQRATYPARQPVLMWRTFLVMIWSFGMRATDLIRMPRSAVLWNDRLVRFVADKTSKLQGLPITPLVEHHLHRWFEALETMPGDRLFPDLKTTGHRLASGQWKAGYYTTWRREIAAGVPRVTWQNFRQLAVTELNDISPGVGAWCAAHSAGGSLRDVSSVSYDLPNKRIREAFVARQAPACFQVPCHPPVRVPSDGPITSLPSEAASHSAGVALPRVE